MVALGVNVTWGGGAGTSLYEADVDGPLEGVAFSRLD